MAHHSWSQLVWQQAQPMLLQITKQPFNQELMQGTLDPEKFTHYIQQDALYLKQFSKAIANIIPKLSEPDHIKAFLGFLQDTMTVESVLHQQYLSDNVVQNELEMSPTCLMYTQFLLATTSMDSAPIGIASILPCFWIYKYVGDYILAHYEQNQNPYFEWIQTYSGEEYGQAVMKAIQIVDILAETQSETVRKRMDEVFLKACKMEYLFWDSAYQQEEWKV